MYKTRQKLLDSMSPQLQNDVSLGRSWRWALNAFEVYEDPAALAQERFKGRTEVNFWGTGRKVTVFEVFMRWIESKAGSWAPG